MGIVLGVLLVVVGSILTFAVQLRTVGDEVHVVGWILMAAGPLWLIVALTGEMHRRRRAHTATASTDEGGSSVAPSPTNDSDRRHRVQEMRSLTQ